MMREISCSNPRCECKILRKSNDGMWRFSTKVIKTNEDGTGIIAICKSCGRENVLPVQISIPSTLSEYNSSQDRLQKSGFGVINIKKT